MESQRRFSVSLLPGRKDRPHDEIADQLVAGIDGEELHTLLREQRSGLLHGGDEAEPHMKAHHQAEVPVLRAKPVQDQGQGESG